MCGILGSWDVDSNLQDDHVISALQKMNNRGPNDSGYETFLFQGAANLILGHTRLSIIDLSDGGHQPMPSACGRFHIVFNGEIYNYKELRKELIELGHSFKSDSDTEVLLVSWKVWGQKCLVRLIGMFAFAIYDRLNMSLTCVRDGFGIKPFLYSSTQKGLNFASDMSALLILNRQKPRLNWQRSYDYLVHNDYDSQPDSLIDGVAHLLPGCLMTLNLNTNELSAPIKWWTPSFKQTFDLPFDQAADCVRNQFLENIKLHLRSDVPLGAALSGGIDSSAVVCAMRHLEPSLPINTFSYIAKDSPVSEEKWVDYINEHVGAKAHKIVANGHELLRDLDDLILAQGEPFGSTSIYAQYRVFQLAKESGVTVTLDGQGADELLAGYRGYPMQRVQSLVEERDFIGALSFANKWRNWPGRTNLDAAKIVGAGFAPNELRPYLKEKFIKPSKPAWLNLNVLMDANVSLSHKNDSQSNNAKSRRVIETLINTLQVKGLPQLLRHGDRDSMRFSIESRVPFLTIPMAELLMSMPEKYLISSMGETKSVFRAAMRGIVPDVILDRRDKVGFETPEKVWLKEMSATLRGWLEVDIGVPFLNQKELLHEFDLIMADKKPFTWQVWRWVNFVRWVQIMGIKT